MGISINELAAILGQSVRPLQLVIKTDQPNASPLSDNLTTSSQFRLTLNPNYGGYNFLVEWGDGSRDYVTCAIAIGALTMPIVYAAVPAAGASTTPGFITGYLTLYAGVAGLPSLLHTYQSPGTYTVSIRPVVRTGLPSICFNDQAIRQDANLLYRYSTDCYKVTELKQWGSTRWMSLDGFLQGCRNILITATDSARAQTQDVWNWDRAFCYCQLLTSFPGDLNTSAGTYFVATWNGTSLTSFPTTLNLSKGEFFIYAWTNFVGTSFPLLNLPKAKTVYGAFGYSPNLTTFPAMDLSNVRDIGNAWQQCGISTFPRLDFPKAVNAAGAFYGTTRLNSFPLCTFPVCWNFVMWFEASHLWDVPALDLRAGKNFIRAWNYANRQSDNNVLRSIDPGLNLSGGLDFTAVFGEGNHLPSFPPLDMAKGLGFSSFCTAGGVLGGTFSIGTGAGGMKMGSDNVIEDHPGIGTIVPSCKVVIVSANWYSPNNRVGSIQLQHSLDGGLTWAPTPNNAFGPGFYEDNIAGITDWMPGLPVSVDGATNWKWVTLSGTGIVGTVSSIMSYPHTVVDISAHSGADVLQLQYSSNGGNTWTVVPNSWFQGSAVVNNVAGISTTLNPTAVNASGGMTTWKWVLLSGAGSSTVNIKTGVVNYSNMWASGRHTSFPGDIDYSKGSIFAGAWQGNSALVTFPVMTLPEAVNMNAAFNGWGTSSPHIGSNFPRLHLPKMTNGVNMLQGSAIGTPAYSLLLNDLAADNPYHNVVFHGGSDKYDNSASVARNTTLVATLGWTITDSGVVAPTGPLVCTPNTGSHLGGTAVTITGANFFGTSAVKFDGVSCPSFTVVDAQTITCVTPATSVGPHAVAVTTPGGTISTNSAFTFT